MSVESEAIGRTAVRQTLWVAGGTYLKTGLNFLFNVALMRLIAPDQFGVLAMGMFFLTLSRKLLGFGFNHALVHRRENLDEYIPTHLWLSVGTAVVTGLAAWVAHPLVAARYGEPTADALRWLGIFGVFELGGETPRLMLEKELRFKPLIILDVANVGISNIVGVTAALFGLGWWALLAKQVVAWAIQSVGAWRIAPSPTSWRPNWTAARWYITFGTPLLWAGIATFISLQFDDFLVGHLSGNEQLGYYARAFSLASFPTAMVTHIVGRVAFPLYSRVRHDPDALSAAFNRVLRVILTLTSPFVLLLALLAPEVVPLVFGEKWTPMVTILQMLVGYAFLRPVYDNCGELFTALGHPEVTSRILIAQAVAVLVGAPPLTWAFGVYGAAAAVGLALAVGVVRAYQHVPRYVNFSHWQAFGPTVVAGIVAVAVSLLFATHPGAGPVARMAWKALYFLLAYGAIIAILDGRGLVRDLRRLRAQFV